MPREAGALSISPAGGERGLGSGVWLDAGFLLLEPWR